MTASIEGMQRVLRAVESGGGDQGGQEGRGGEEEIYNIYNILTHAHTEKKRAAVTSLGHRRQCWQVGTPLSLCNKDLSLSTYYKAVREGGGGNPTLANSQKFTFGPPLEPPR
jgi:hypothetical protein